ncbi:hypothetical protein V7S43_004303 [Phytophthora oleae]|uniref:Uncharacterized protein n=1 Tax=Phytophthora oleae TaxID=2107226 RepID=A0ABD3FXG5_9STRA
MHISPVRTSKRKKGRQKTTRGGQMQQELGQLLQPSPEEAEKLQNYVQMNLPALIDTAARNTRSATYQPGKNEVLRVEVSLEHIAPHHLLPEELQNFWGQFSWAENPWISELSAPVLSRTKYRDIADVSLEELAITRVTANMYTVKVLTPAVRSHSTAKLERWVLAILLCSPRLEVGDQLGANPRIKLRNPPAEWSEIKWTMAENGDVTGTAPDGDQQWQLQQNLDGIY